MPPMTPNPKSAAAGSIASLDDHYLRVRSRSLQLCETLDPEDCLVQTIPSVSPTKWHLAHTTWFFEQFILVERAAGYRVFHQRFDYLFNSYYYTKGQMHPRHARGLLSRPTLAEIRNYREHVDTAMEQLLGSDDSAELRFLVELGLNHEQQHQELMLTDIKHVLFSNPLHPAFAELPMPPTQEHAVPLQFAELQGGINQVGADDAGFAFDNEHPRHRILLEPFQLAQRLITNNEYLEFMGSGGYADPRHWLADGWAWLQETGTDRPMYWSEDRQTEFTLGGMRPLDQHAPVCHLNYYEADAYARWADARLPTEAEWESAAAALPIAGNTADAGFFQPQASGDSGLSQIYGDTWEWTSSAYAPYPGFEPLAGSLGEYNGKFMANQMVCRGGSCVTPADHLRATYRNFFYPHERWQFFGIRLAKNPQR